MINDDTIELGAPAGAEEEKMFIEAANAPEVSNRSYAKRTVGVDDDNAGGGIMSTGQQKATSQSLSQVAAPVSMVGKFVLSGFSVTTPDGKYLPINDWGASEESLKKRFLGKVFMAKLPDGSVEACDIEDGNPSISKDGVRVCRMVEGQWSK